MFISFNTPKTPFSVTLPNKLLLYKISNRSLKCTLFWGHFVPFLGRIMCFMLYYALLFQFYARVWFFSVFYRFLDHFTPNLTVNECSVTPHRHPEVTMPVEGRKSRRVPRQSSSWTVRGEGHGLCWGHNCNPICFASSCGWGWLNSFLNKAISQPIRGT